MSIHNFEPPIKQVLYGNILLILCCAFYLAWWLLAFRPIGAVGGIKTGWLLIPASLSGIFAVVLMIRSISSITVSKSLLPGHSIIWCGAAVYVILLIVTGVLLKRPVTTELVLIVGWAVLALSEVNMLFGIELFSHRTAVLFFAVIIIAAVISLFCYLIYYHLGSLSGYYDGMIPLLLVALTMAGLTSTLLFQ